MKWTVPGARWASGVQVPAVTTSGAVVGGAGGSGTISGNPSAGGTGYGTGAPPPELALCVPWIAVITRNVIDKRTMNVLVFVIICLQRTEVLNRG